MGCCSPYTQPFSNTSLVTVDYGENMREQYGTVPKIAAYFFNTFLSAYMVLNNIPATIIGDKIIIDFGDILTGYIKIS